MGTGTWACKGHIRDMYNIIGTFSGYAKNTLGTTNKEVGNTPLHFNPDILRFDEIFGM